MSIDNLNDNDKSAGYYAIITANVRYDKDLTPNAKLLYGEISALSHKEGYCWASNKYFADLYDVSTVSISKWISQLINKGYVRSKIIYADGSKQILYRYLSIVIDPIKQKFDTPIKQKFKDNNTLLNNTSNIKLDNNNPEIQNFGFEQELFENESLELEAKKQKPKEKSCPKKEKVVTIEDLAFPLINEFWLKEFKQGYQYTAKDGSKVKSIIKKIKSSILSVNDFCDQITILNAFKAICSNLNKLGDFYATADLSIIDSKYNTIIEQIKTMKNGKQQTNNRQATATSAAEYARRKYGL